MESLEPVKRKTRRPQGLKKAKSRLGRTTSLEKALQEEREKANECLSRLMYLQADFENYRKRTEKRISEIAIFGNKRLIVNFLSVIDEMEMAIQAGKETENKDDLLKGIEMILKKTYSTLEREGLTKIEAVGTLFNPKIHEVAMKVPTKEHDEGVVVEEVRKGFMLGDKVIRPSVVTIATEAGVDS